MADNNNVPTLSILVATFNCIDNFIGLCENLNSQDCQRFELLVADGSSSADISRLLRRSYIPQLGWFKSAPDDGIYNGLNQLIPHVRGSYTLVMGCDDRFVDVNSLNKLCDVLDNRGGDVGMFYSNLLLQDGKKVRLKEYPALGIFSSRFRGLPFFHHQSVVVRSDHLIRECFDESYSLHSDFHLMSSLYCSSVHIEKIDDAFVVFECGGKTSRMSMMTRSYKELDRVYRRFADKSLPFRLKLYFLRAFISKFSIIKFNEYRKNG